MQSNLYPHVHKLWLFSLVADCQSFRQAASQARITQSALSQSVKVLEGLFGRTLLLRGRGLVTLTDEGAALLRKARPVLASIDALGNAPRQSVLGSSVRLGAYESMGLHLFPGLVRRLRKVHPDVAIVLRTGRTATLTSFVRNGELDLAIVDEARDPALRSEPFAKDRLGIFVSPKLDPAPNLEVLRGLDLATLAPTRAGLPEYYKAFVAGHLEYLRGKAIVPTSFCTSDSLETLRALATSGLVAAVLPRRVALRTKDDLVELKLPSRAVSARGEHSFYLLSRTVMEASLVDMFRRELHRLAADGALT